MSKLELSDPIPVRLPVDVLTDIEKIAAVTDRSRSWVMVRALKLYLAKEGAQILNIVAGREEAAQGGWHDMDDVIAQLDQIVQGKVAQDEGSPVRSGQSLHCPGRQVPS